MDEENKEEIDYQKIIDALHGFGLTDYEIQMRMNYVMANPEIVEQFRGRDISPEDVRPYVFPTEDRTVDGGGDLEEEPYPADTGTGMDENEDLFFSDNPYDDFEFKDFGMGSFDYEGWKYDTARRIEGGRRNHPEIIDDDVYNEFLVMQNTFSKRIEKALISAYNDYQDDPVSLKLEEKYRYYKDLQAMLYNQMIKIAPVEFLSSLTWQSRDTGEINRYSEREAENIVYHYNCLKGYDSKYLDFEAEIKKFEAEHPDMDEREENEYNILLAKQRFFDIKCAEHGEQVPIDIDQFRMVVDDAKLAEMAERHSAQIEDLLSQAKEAQEKQIELLSSYELGDIKVNPRDEVEDLQKEFKRINGKIDFLKNLGTILGIEKEKGDEEIEQDDGIIKASGKDILALMDKKQRYIAKKSVHAMEKGKAPGWLKRQALRLPIGNTDDLIIAYIDSGKLDVEEILGYSREEIGVNSVAKRIARETREEREREAKRPKIRTDNEDREEGGEPESEDHKDGKPEDEEGKDKGKEPEDVEPEGGEGKGEGEEPKGEPAGSDDVSKTIEEIMSKFDSLSTEARVEIYAKQFGLDEQGKKIFALFDSLSQEGKEALYQKMFGDKENSKEDPIKDK